MFDYTRPDDVQNAPVIGSPENIRLLKLAEGRNNDKTTSFASLVTEEGFALEEIKELAESVEFE